ncbi:hypothetical protein BZL43_08520 [Pseudomonas sp. PICF141]|nr:hypothetical protein BZL43_08520 [Pseudomonas sp. PICF141]
MKFNRGIVTCVFSGQKIAAPCSSCRACEAAFGGEAVANPVCKVFLTHRNIRFHDCFAAERSLAGSAAATTIHNAEQKNHKMGHDKRVRGLLKRFIRASPNPDGVAI